MKTIIATFAMLCAAFTLAAQKPAKAPKPYTPTGRELVDVVRILNDSLTRGHAGFYLDGRIVSQQEVDAIPASRIASTTILYGGRPYIDKVIREMLAETPKIEPAAK